jgi:AcrR family transcriptional regulator
MPDITRSRAAAGLAPVTPQRVVATALELTAREGLDGWSLRQVARELGVGPRVVYHHVGDHETLLRAVAEQVIAKIALPDPALDWREWFTALLTDGRRVLRGYPGVARRLITLGPVMPAALAIMDRGIQVLLAAGFGDDAIAAYRFLTNTAFSQIAVEDERREHHPDARTALGTLLVSHRNDAERPGLAFLAADIAARGVDAADTEKVDAQFYEYTVRRALDGVAATPASAPYNHSTSP